MKRFILLLLCLPTAKLPAQWIVHDPANTAVNSAIQAAQAANHAESIRQWAEQLERLNRQIRHMEDQLAAQQRIRDTLGDPAAAGLDLLRGLGAGEFARTYGETAQAVRRLADAVESLRSTADGIYRELDNRTTLGREFSRQTAPYRRFAAVDRQAAQVETVRTETEPRLAELQTELAATLGALRSAPTQAEVDKLSAKLSALNGQLALLVARRRDETDRLLAARILNESQADKERVDLLERQNAEERGTLDVVNTWQSSLRLAPTAYTRP